MKANTKERFFGGDFSTMRTLIACAIIAIIIFFAQKVQGAVTVTTLTSFDDIPAFNSPTIGARLYGQIGNGTQSGAEVQLFGQTTANINYDWMWESTQITGSTTTLTTFSAGPTATEVDLNGDGGVASAGPVNLNVTTYPVNTFYIYARSVTAPENSISLQNLTLNRSGLGSVSLGELVTSGFGANSSTPTFVGMKVVVEGGTGPIDISTHVVFSHAYENDADPAFGNRQYFGIIAEGSIPEPSSAMLLCLGLVTCFIRRR